MPEENYTNREIREFLKDINEKLERIEAQTIRTNGRVSKLENWRSYTAGAIAVILLIGVPIGTWIINQVINHLK